MWWLVACAPPPAGVGTDSEASFQETGDTRDTDGTGDTGDTGDTAPKHDTGDTGTAPCPAGMVGIGAPPAFCIFQYEASLDGDSTVSVEGVLPWTGVTFLAARAACQAQGWRLATSSEWLDAGDGQLGAGGTAYPYGDTLDDTACATPLADGTVVYQTLQPTGSLKDCVSAWGTYDQSGNAFEWADPELALDLAAFEAAHPTVVDVDGYLATDAATVEALIIEAAGVPKHLWLDEQGVIHAEINPEGWKWDASLATGYLIEESLTADASGWYPIEIEPIDDTWTEARLRLRADQDGVPLTDKRGGAYYTGAADSSALAMSSMTHTADFDGTISFRCAADPL